MAKVALLNQTGSSVGDIELNDAVFGIEPNQQVIFDVINAQRAALRQGSHSVKNRSEVRGGGRKPWKQKGTGRARQGSIRSPQWRGGGVVFGPTTDRNYKVKVNKKVARLALKSALSTKFSKEQLKVVDKIELKDVKTKEFKSIVNALNNGEKTLFVLGATSNEVILSARNIPNVFVTTAEHASVLDIANYKNLVLDQDAVNKLEGVLANG